MSVFDPTTQLHVIKGGASMDFPQNFIGGLVYTVTTWTTELA